MEKQKLCLECIGRNIKRLRTDRKMTQFALACDLDTDKSLISALERGAYKNISIKTLLKICNIFDVELFDLIK